MEEKVGNVPGARLLFEVSTTLVYAGRNAVGIVRAEREIASHLLRLADPAVRFVLLRGGTLSEITPEQVGAAVRPPPPDTAVAALAVRPGIGDRCRQRGQALVRGLARAILALLPARQVERLRRWRRGRGLRAVAGTSFAPRPGDVLMLVGLLWNFVDCQRLAALQRQSGLAVVPLIHDLIPVRFPAFIGDGGAFYARFFADLFACSTKLLCNSRCTETDVLAFLAAIGRAPLPTAVLPLGANLPVRPDGTPFAAQPFGEKLEKGRFALTVGTVEMRKNHALLLDLWEDLSAEPDFDLDLVIVGRPGWGAKATIARLYQSQFPGSRVLWFPHLADGALAWLYERCHMVLYPSFYEGWGLPVMEALAYGRPVIASDRGATPEAAFGLATLLDPANGAGWRAAILAAARTPRRNVATPPLPTWNETMHALLAEARAASPSGEA